MKKIIFIFFVLFFSVFAANMVFAAANNHDRTALLEQEWQSSQNGVALQGEKRTTRLTIPNVAGSGEARAAVGGLEKKLLGTKKNPGGVIGGIKDSVDAQAGQIGTLAGEVQQNTDAVRSINGELQKVKDVSWEAGNALLGAVKSALGWTLFWVLLGILLATLLVGIALWALHKKHQREEKAREDALRAYTVRIEEERFRREADLLASMRATQEKLDELKEELNEVPTKTADRVKKLDPIEIDFETRGHKVKYVPPIESNTYITLHVPTDVSRDVSDPSKIKRTPKDNRGKVYESVLATMRNFFDGRFDDASDPQSCQQKELIRFAQAIGQLKI